MKREYNKKHKALFTHYGLLFWKRCCKCGYEFRREPGYMYLGKPYYNGSNPTYYLCSTCAPTADVANKLALQGVHRGERPPPPPNKR